MELKSILVVAGMGLALWLIVEFYWLRKMALAALLVGWGAVAIAAPVWLAVRHMGSGDYLMAIVTAVVASLPALIWFFTVFGHVLPAVQRDMRQGLFFRPWNSRD